MIRLAVILILTAFSGCGILANTDKDTGEYCQTSMQAGLTNILSIASVGYGVKAYRNADDFEAEWPYRRTVRWHG